MKHSIAVLFLIAAAACSGGAKSGPTSPANPGPPTEQPGEQPGEQPPVEQAAGPSCSQEIAIRCRAPGVDGCDKGLTTVHVCVPNTETAGPPCEQEIARACPAGQVDGCLRKPPVSKVHVCVMN